MSQSTEFLQTYTCDACGTTAKSREGWGQYYTPRRRRHGFGGPEYVDYGSFEKLDFCSYACGVELLKRHNPSLISNDSQ